MGIQMQRRGGGTLFFPRAVTEPPSVAHRQTWHVEHMRFILQAHAQKV